ncbi:putative 6-phosphogluconolactonase [Trypanosoma vivax]|nr:putative 6-phosphogluconolactonase [Trypanosoma vivax]
MLFHPVVEVYSSAEELSAAGCEKILQIIDAPKAEEGPLSIALSGGSTPKAMYELLHDKHIERLRKGRALRFFFGDERLVQPNSPDSNFNMAHLALLRDVPDDLVVPLDVQALATDEAAAEDVAAKIAEAYERRIVSLLKPEAGTGAPVFDIVLLGLGSDGHTASIFPGSQAERERDGSRSVSIGFPSETMHPKVWRVTLTPSAISRARHVIVLATGAEKRWVLEGILSDNPQAVPVARFLRNCKGKVTFLLDRNIAEGLSACGTVATNAAGGQATTPSAL